MGVGGALQQFLRGKRKTQSRECHPKKKIRGMLHPKTTLNNMACRETKYCTGAPLEAPRSPLAYHAGGAWGTSSVPSCEMLVKKLI